MNLKNRQMATTSALLDGSARSQRLVISSDTVEASQILRGWSIFTHLLDFNIFQHWTAAHGYVPRWSTLINHMKMIGVIQEMTNLHGSKDVQKMATDPRKTAPRLSRCDIAAKWRTMMISLTMWILIPSLWVPCPKPRASESNAAYNVGPPS